MSKKANYRKAKNAAEAIIKDYEIDTYVVPVTDICKLKGLKIKFFVPENNESLQDVSGLLEFDKKTIYVNNNDSFTRQRFTIAHELGHWELHQSKKEEVGVLYRLSTPISDQPVEKEANCFAANLLVPEKVLRSVLKKYKATVHDIGLLADLFGVSESFMRYRFKAVMND